MGLGQEEGCLSSPFGVFSLLVIWAVSSQGNDKHPVRVERWRFGDLEMLKKGAEEEGYEQLLGNRRLCSF